MLKSEYSDMTISRSFRVQRGFSLIELLISITIGLVIMIAIALSYSSSNNISKQKQDLIEINEPIKIITRMIKYNISQAGYVDIFDSATSQDTHAAILFTPNAALQNMYVRAPIAGLKTPLQQLFPGLNGVFGCDGAMSSTANTIVTSGSPAVHACGTANSTKNSIQFSYQAISRGGSTFSSTTTTNAITGEGLDCLQRSPPTGAFIVINRFFVQTNPSDNVSELYCQGSGDTPAGQLSEYPLARGVEEFIVRYQLAAPGSTGVVAAAGNGKTQYLTATQVTADGIGWAGVNAIELCVVTATPQTKGAAAIGTVDLQPSRPTCARDAQGNFNADITRAAGDTRLWKRFTLTYSVRNNVFSTPI